jgi:heat shock protein HtpX
MLPDLHLIVDELARRARIPTPSLHYVPSRLLNAFAVGNRSRSAIGVTDGLLRSLNLRELAGVLAHEISHIRHNDMWVMGLADVVSRVTTLLSQIGLLLVIVLLPLALLGLVELSLLGLSVLIAAPFVNNLLQFALSRTREYDADLGAVELTGDPQGLASALDKLERYQGGWVESILLPGRRIPDPAMLRTHPPTRERIHRLLSLAPNRPLGPPLGRSLRSDQAATMADFPVIARRPRWHLNGLWH